METEIGPLTGGAYQRTTRATGVGTRDDGDETRCGVGNARANTTDRHDQEPCKKRKASPTESREADDGVLGVLIDDLSVACDRLTRSLRDTAYDQHEVVNEDNLNDLRKAVRAIKAHNETVKNRPPRVGSPDFEKPAMIDAATDTQLTPHWWEASRGRITDTSLAELGRSQEGIGAMEKPALTSRATKKTTGTYASAVGRRGFDHLEEDRTEAEFTLVERRRKPRPTQPNAAPREDRPKPGKPPAVLIKVADGETFEETLKSVRGAIDPTKLGVDVK